MELLRESLTELLTRGVGQYVSLKPGRGIRDHAAYVDWMIERHAVGPAEHVADRLAASAEKTGVRRQLLMVEGIGAPEAVGDNIAALGALLSDTAGTALRLHCLRGSRPFWRNHWFAEPVNRHSSVTSGIARLSSVQINRDPSAGAPAWLLASKPV